MNFIHINKRKFKNLEINRYEIFIKNYIAKFELNFNPEIFWKIQCFLISFIRE